MTTKISRYSMLLFSALSWTLASVMMADSATAQTPVQVDTLTARCGPAGFGSLKEEDVMITVSLPGGVQVSATPLDECVIRMLSPDAYKALQSRKVYKKPVIDSVVRNYRLRSYSLWSVLFLGLQQGEARFSPNEFVIRNVGRDFQPVKIIPLTNGFGDNRVRQREAQRAIYVFDGQIDINQPLSAIIQGQPSDVDWTALMQRVEQERVLVRSRAASKGRQQ